MFSWRPSIPQLIRTWNKRSEEQGYDEAVLDRTGHYQKYFNETDDKKAVEIRKKNFSDVSNTYYDLTTDFYEFGWGESIHFATLRKDENREHSFAKYEYMLALKLGLKPKDHVLDAGCGIGGPARHIAAFSGAHVTGVNCNDHQLSRARELTKIAELDNLCSFIKGDYHHLPYSDDTFDKAYAIEATCHSPNVAKVYAEIKRVLKPGGLFACCEWIMTEKYDPDDAYHRQIKQDIMEGDGLPDILTIPEVHEAVKESGFEIVEASDHALISQVPWYMPLKDRWMFTTLGRIILHYTFLSFETIGIIPPGYSEIHKTMCKAIDGLGGGGELGIFSPMYVMILKKPDAKS